MSTRPDTALAELGLRPEVEAAYTKFMQDHHGEVDVLLLADTMWNAGARTAIKSMVAFNDLPLQVARVERRIAEISGILASISEP